MGRVAAVKVESVAAAAATAVGLVRLRVESGRAWGVGAVAGGRWRV